MGSYQRPSLDADDLLVNGYFKTSRGRQATPPTPPSTSYSLATPAFPDTRRQRPTKSPRASRTGWPPRPHVEDESESLSRELEGYTTAQAAHDPPFRGVIDQQPILYASNLSASDAAKSDTTIKEDGNAERRFVLIPRSDTHSPVRDDDAGLPRTRRQQEQQTEPRRADGQGDRRRKETRESPSPITRRKSRQDLPALATKLESAQPPSRRPASPYASTSQTKDPSRIGRSPPTSVFLSPDVATAKSSSKGYFDIAAQSLPRKYGGSSPRPTTPNNSSRPSTPNLEKTSRASFDTQVRPKAGLPERLTRPQQFAEENSSHRSERPTSRLDRKDSSERRHSRQSSTQSSRNEYTSSDLEDSDSAGSDKRRSRHRRHYPRHGDSLYPEDEKDRHRRTGSKSDRSSTEFGQPQKRFSSPLPSPGTAAGFMAAGMAAGMLDNQRKETYPLARDARRPISRPISPLSALEGARASKTPTQAAPVRSKELSPVSIDPRSRESRTSLPIPIPTNGAVHDGRISASSQRGDHSAGTSPANKGYWQPPPFQPPVTTPSHLDPPAMGSVRRFSQDIEAGTIAPLPPCPRTSPVRGKADWLTLPKCPNFRICPTCYQSAIEPTPFRTFFVPAPFRSLDDEIICAFGSQPWYRIAWLLTQKNRENDLSLIYQIASISATTPPCPGADAAVRKWHSILEPSTGQPIRNFDVCAACVKTISVLLPALRGVFVPTNAEGPAGARRACDMRFDTERFVDYFDALELAAEQTPRSAGRWLPDVRGFAAVVRRFAAVPGCRGRAEVRDARWYGIAQLPEFTVCAECFEGVVRPEVERRRAIAEMFELGRRQGTGSCQLYSERMRGVFRDAVGRDDYRALTRAVRERREMEREYKWDLEDAMKLRGVEREEEVQAVEREWRRWE